MPIKLPQGKKFMGGGTRRAPRLGLPHQVTRGPLPVLRSAVWSLHPPPTLATAGRTAQGFRDHLPGPGAKNRPLLGQGPISAPQQGGSLHRSEVHLQEPTGGAAVTGETVKASSWDQEPGADFCSHAYTGHCAGRGLGVANRRGKGFAKNWSHYSQKIGFLFF